MVLRITIEVAGLKAKLSTLQARMPRIQKRLMITIGARLEAEMKRAITSGPLKALDTGNYRASVVHVFANGEVRVGPTKQAPYGRRIALGFVGTDSLGRRINQKARPQHEKAVEIVVPEIPAIARAVIEQETADLR